MTPTMLYGALRGLFSGRTGIVVLATLAAVLLSTHVQDDRDEMQKQFKKGNYADAYELARKILLKPGGDPKGLAEDFGTATQCLAQLSRSHELDAFREEFLGFHGDKWRTLQAAALSFMFNAHQGTMVDNVFLRQGSQSRGEWMNAFDRDRVQAVRHFQKAMPIALGDTGASREDRTSFLMNFANCLMSSGDGQASWRLQVATDLETLPDYEEGYWRQRPTSYAPVGEDGEPIYYGFPSSFDAAKNDGERWMWAMMQAVEIRPEMLASVLTVRADFLYSNFGTHTVGYLMGEFDDEDAVVEEGQREKLHTLTDDETLARLATGVRRIRLPDEHNYIKLMKRVAAMEDAKDERIGACERLAGYYEARHQFRTAAEWWQKVIDYASGDRRQAARTRRKQIVGNWASFDGTSVQPAGEGAKVGLRFRNAKEIEFTARPIDVAKLLGDVKDYISSDPRRLDWQRINVGDLGSRLVNGDLDRYVGRSIAEWTVGLEPKPDHFDKRIEITTPLQKAGAYVLEAEVDDGNDFKIIIWVADTLLSKKPMEKKQLWFVADAMTGTPVAKANVEFFGYRQRHTGGNRYVIDTQRFAEFSDENGLVMLDDASEMSNFSWLVTARTDAGRLAYVGFTNVWSGGTIDAQYDETRTLVITDRPVYRPKQKVEFKCWVNRSRYDLPDRKSDYEGRRFLVKILDPKSEEFANIELTADEYGGFNGTIDLPDEATLGTWYLHIPDFGQGSFRVEEYKKPEYEVTVDAPKKPVMLGEKIQAKVTARYYFGSPVTSAKVKYKVLRTSRTTSWYPSCTWDWFYGTGYWWFGQDYEWYPGFGRWGCFRPVAWWWHMSSPQPEVVAEDTVPIGEDGTITIDIDTALAKAVHGDEDHEYSITAEVVDASRHTIVGQGSAIVARDPFKVYVWVDRGHYRIGETIESDVAALTPSGEPVKGSGTLELRSIVYDDKGQPTETVVQSWPVETDAEGRIATKLSASKSGQYRLVCKLKDGEGHEQEGGYMLVITGEGFDGAAFRFNKIELVPDKKEYAPGEKVRLMINTEQIGSTVLLFVRAGNGVYPVPRVLHLTGKSTMVELDVTLKDMPNFFVEALTVSRARAHTEVREIIVPPAKRVLDVQVQANAAEYLPGAPAEIDVTVKDDEGKPFVGSTVVAIYDRSVEYISGGSNVPEIRAHFWKWRRQHNVQIENNGTWTGWNLVDNGDEAMQSLGQGRGYWGGIPNLGFFFDLDSSNGFSKNARVRRGAERLRDGLTSLSAPSGDAGGVYAEAAAPSARPQDEMMDLAESKDDSAMDFDMPGTAEPTVRQNFADTAYWIATLATDSEGRAKVKLDMPENLTTWRIRTWCMGRGTRVGQGQSDVVTRKNVIVRLQAPRFFVQTDEVVLSANVHNYLAEKKSVRVALELEGTTLSAIDALEQTVEIDAQGEARVDWRVKVLDEGEAIVRMKALTDVESDAMEMRFPVYIHGMLKTDSVSGVVRADRSSSTFEVNVPEARRIPQTRLEVRYSPTLAGAMVDALPYLVEYPYGCTEQTLSRFLPTVITQRILQSMNLDLEDIRTKRTNLNAQEIGDDVERAKGWKHYDRNPVFDEAEVRRMVKAGLRELTSMQCSDGGWGWFSGYGERSWPHTTAWVVHGLQVAKANDMAIAPDLLERGTTWLREYQKGEIRKLSNAKDKTRPYKSSADNLDAFVYMVLRDAGIDEKEMREYLFRDRLNLSVYGMSMLGMAIAMDGSSDQLTTILENIRQYLVIDDENQTAWLHMNSSGWWYWYGSEIEAHAYYLKLLVRTDPKGDLAPRIVKYLLNNRKNATWWNSTRDTALCVEALADYWRVSGEGASDLEVEILVDGASKKKVTIKPSELFSFDNKLVIEGDALETGKHTIEMKKVGSGPLYFNAYMTNFTLEDHITKAGLEVKVERRLYKLVPEEATALNVGERGQALNERVEKYRRELLAEGATLTSGDLVEIELVLESKNDYEYLIFEDMKASGFEPVDLRSGYNGNSLGAYVEFRDERVAFFLRWLPQGKHSLTYRVRAEIPGAFSALPARAAAMYAPELRGNSDEIKVKIVDAR